MAGALTPGTNTPQRPSTLSVNDNNENEHQSLLPDEVVTVIKNQWQKDQPASSELVKIAKEIHAFDHKGAKLRLSEPLLPWGWRKLAPSLLLRFVQITIICLIFWVGGSQKTYNLDNDKLLQSVLVSADVQLAVFGLVNKVLDYLLDTVLEHTVSVALTVWMACTISDHLAGIKVTDFSMKDELSKPWIAFSAFFKRWRKDGWRWKYLLRFLICLSVSFCVLLQGAGVNTIGIPKSRWYPNYWGGVPNADLTLTLPLMRMINTNLDGVWGQASSMRGATDPNAIGQIVAGLSASEVFLGLSNLRSAMNSNQSEPGWYEAYKSNGNYITGINVPTNTSARSIRTLSLQFTGISAIWSTQAAVGTSWARTSTGFTGNLNLTLPLLETQCFPSNLTQIQNSTMMAQRPFNPNSTDATLFVLVGASGNFTGANCSITFRQGLFPVATWVLDGGEPDASLTNYNHPVWFASDPRNPPTYLFAPSTNDTLIASNLADQFNGIGPNLVGLVQRGPTLTDHFIALSRQFVALNRTGLDSDAAGLAPVIGTLLSQILTTATWLEEADPGGATVSNAPIQWQGYGSSPRLRWEWTISIVLGVILVLAVVDIVLIVTYRLSKIPLNDPGDLLMRRVMGVEGLSDKQRIAQSFYLRETAKEAFVTVDKKGGNLLKRDVEYRWRD